MTETQELPAALHCLACNHDAPRAWFVFTIADRYGICRGCTGSAEALRLAGDGDYRARIRATLQALPAAGAT